MRVGLAHAIAKTLDAIAGYDSGTREPQGNCAFDRPNRSGRSVRLEDILGSHLDQNVLLDFERLAHGRAFEHPILVRREIYEFPCG